MKFQKAFILLLLTFAFKFSFSQNYFEDSPLWRMSSVCSTDGNCFSYNDYNYFINGDTVINSHLYKKLFKYGFGYYSWQGPIPVPPSCQGSFIVGSESMPFSYIRDTLNLIYLMGNPEQCLYDFNLNIGDTLPICYGNSNQVVLSIDSLVVNGNYRKIFYLSASGGQSHTIIEGIGHEHGFIEMLPPILDGCGYDLVCYSVNDTSYYPNSNLNCQSVNSIIELTENIIVIYPIPTHGRLFINSNGLLIEKVVLRDMFGSYIKIIENCNIQGVTKLDLPKLPVGYYCLSITTNIGIISKPILVIDY